MEPVWIALAVAAVIALGIFVGRRNLPELRARLSLRYEDSIFRSPPMYGHELSSDDFWILAGRWDTYCPKITRSRIHPLLGWVQGPISEKDPRGLVASTETRLVKDGRRKVLFFGDSYVQGFAQEPNWIPTLLEAELVDTDVLHLGVGGYGTDQMHLLLKDVGGDVDPGALMLMGIMTHSFDRAGLNLRQYQKPRFDVLPNGELKLTNVPINSDPEHYFKTAQLGFKSYVRQAEAYSEEAAVASDYDFEAKVEVNRALIDANLRVTQQLGGRLFYIIFHNYDELPRTTQRADFFKAELESRGIPYFDTRPLLVKYIETKGTDGSELYEEGHLVPEANQVVASALAEALADLSLVARKP